MPGQADVLSKANFFFAQGSYLGEASTALADAVKASKI